MYGRGDWTQHGKPCRWSGTRQPTAREGQVGPAGWRRGPQYQESRVMPVEGRDLRWKRWRKGSRLAGVADGLVPRVAPRIVRSGVSTSFRYTLWAQNQSSRHGPPSGGPDFQRPSNRAPATRVGVSKSLLGRCLCGFEASRTRRASTTSARRDRARPGVVSCSRFSSGATRNGEMRRQIGW